MKRGTLHFEKFGAIDRISDYPTGHALFLDFDINAAPNVPDLYALCRVAGIRPHGVRYDKTQRGWHVVVTMREKLKPMQLVALQAIMGSDPMREALNFARASNPKLLRGFWAQRWNILYSGKVE